MLKSRLDLRTAAAACRAEREVTDVISNSSVHSLNGVKPENQTRANNVMRGKLLAAFCLLFPLWGLGGLRGQTCLDLHAAGISPNGCLQLKWQWNAPPANLYGYTLYQWDSTAGWQSTSLNYDKTIKVLNVYPNIAGSNTLQTWMNDPTVGFGKILVTPVTINNFNSNPDNYLKSAGQYQYDVVMFGSWDGNNYVDINLAATTAVRNFLNAGRGVLFGHDTQSEFSPNFASLMDKTNMEQVIDMNLWRGSTNIKVVNDGFLLKYPHIIPYNSILTIPFTHSTGQFAKGIVWMNFPNTVGNIPSTFALSPEVWKNGGTNNHYLTTWNNAAMIQTGHSNGASTLDERRVLANTLWYLAQFSTDTTAQVCSALDLAAPDIPAVTRQSANCQSLGIISKDNGSLYRFYIKATNAALNTDTCLSDTLEVSNQSGLKGYYILEDNNPTAGQALSSNHTAFIAANDNQLATYSIAEETAYIHIQAVDSAGNLSAVYTLEPLDSFNIIASAGANGTITPNDTLTVAGCEDQTFTFTADTGYQIDQVLIDDINNPAAVTAGFYTFANVTENHTIAVSFKEIVPASYTILATAGANGSINPSGIVSVAAGGSQTFTFSANSGYKINQVLVDSINNPAAATAGNYTFTNVTANHTIDVNFKETKPDELDFDTYAVTKWNNTFLLNLKKLAEEGYKITACKWYKEGIKIGEGFSYSAGNNTTDLLETDVIYTFELSTSSHGTLFSSHKVLHKSLSSLRAYPNPASQGNKLTIEGIVQGNLVEVYDINGACLYQATAAGNTMELSLNVQAGVYIVRSNNEEIKVIIK